MPGSPPISTSDPGTTPPPRRQSNSPRPAESPPATTVSIPEYTRGPAVTARLYRFAMSGVAAGESAACSSTSEFHAPQSAHRPSHFWDCAPHSWQAKRVLFFIAAIQLAAGSWQLETGNWKLPTGNWQLATGNWQLVS